MSGMKRRLLILVAILLVVVAGGVASLYLAATRTQEMYTAALQQDPVMLAEKGRQLETRFSTLHSDLQSPGDWTTVISAEEINGWLATKLPELFPELLPPEIQDPRVAITPELVWVAAQAELSGLETVVSIGFEPFATDQGDLAILLHQVLAGALPLPKKEIVDRLSAAVEGSDLPIRWTQQQGETVLILHRQLWEADPQQLRRLEVIELADGQLFLSGRTEELSPASLPTKEADWEKQRFFGEPGKPSDGAATKFSR